jgi:predicted transposase YdaD
LEHNIKQKGIPGFLSDEEKEQLLKQLDETISQVADEQDVKVDELTNEVEELKQKVKLNEPENI